jgi:hypothetical protein
MSSGRFPGEQAGLDVVISVCKDWGYGNVMHTVSEAWRKIDPVGALSVGPCYGMLETYAARLAALERVADLAREGSCCDRDGDRSRAMYRALAALDGGDG